MPHVGDVACGGSGEGRGGEECRTHSCVNDARSSPKVGSHCFVCRKETGVSVWPVVLVVGGACVGLKLRSAEEEDAPHYHTTDSLSRCSLTREATSRYYTHEIQPLGTTKQLPL